VSEILLDEIAAAAAAEISMGRGTALASKEDVEAAESNGKADGRTGSARHGALQSCVRCCHQLIRCVTRLCSSHEEREEVATLYSCIVHARTTSGFKHLFGLTSRSHTLYLHFPSPEERARFLLFVHALLPPTIRVAHVGAASAPATSPEAIPEEAPAADPRDAPASAPASLVPQQAGFELPPLDLPPLGPRARTGKNHGLTPWQRAPAASKAPITQLGGVTGGLSADPDAPMRTIQTEPLSLFVGTWNMGDSVPPPALEGWIPREAHDLYAVATQECSDEHWLAALDSHLGSSYVRITERRMGSIFLVVFTHRRHAAKISSVESSYIPTGVLGVGTNKGAVALAF